MLTHVNVLTGKIIGAAIEVHRHLVSLRYLSDLCVSAVKLCVAKFKSTAEKAWMR